MREIYWHIQMNQPWGRNKGKIDSRLMLKDALPIIGTGEWDDFQCRNFTGESSQGLEVNDIILVREGSVAIALCKIKSDCFKNSKLKAKFHHDYYRYVEILSYYTGLESFPQPQSTLQRLHNPKTDSWKFINKFYYNIMELKDIEKIEALLKYKKQIILQGSPGTGKTRLAKEIAKKMISNNNKFEVTYVSEINIKDISTADLKHVFHQDDELISTSKSTYYKVLEIYDNRITVRGNNRNQDDTITFDTLIECLKNPESFPLGTGLNSQIRSAMNYVIKNLPDKIKTVQSEQKKEMSQEDFQSHYTKLIQFHPSYTYEDFVRGIVAKPNKDGGGIIYEAENKILGKFAKEALKNHLDSNKEFIAISSEAWLDNTFSKFVLSISDQLEENGIVPLTNKINLISLDNDAFRYKGEGDGWNTAGDRMHFKDIKQAYVDDNKKRQDLVNNKLLSGLGNWHATYYLKVLNLFKEFIDENNLSKTSYEGDRVQLNKYIIIIDEINRANLSSVLGELIYALEYRGEAVESMYEVDSKELILPPNLYIVGTMNTADRSVGHIDYAIRRRFAFVDVVPKDLTNDLGSDFETTLFNKVSELFDHSSYLSREFNAKDVQLGQSYFIHQYEKDSRGNDIKDKPHDFKLRLEYEIKPILIEYIKDGILINDEEDNLVRLVNNLEKYLS